MLEKAEGVVLSTRRSGESSVSATALLARHGKIRLTAKGVLSKKDGRRGALQPGHHVQVLFYLKPNRHVYFVKEVDLVGRPAAADSSLELMASRLAAMEILDLVCYPGSPADEVVELAIDFVSAPAPQDPLLMFLAFAAKLLERLGAFPDVETCAECGKAADEGIYRFAEGSTVCRSHGAGGEGTMVLRSAVREALLGCLTADFEVLGGATLAPESRKDLGKLIHWTYTSHVQGYSLPKSLSLL